MDPDNYSNLRGTSVVHPDFGTSEKLLEVRLSHRPVYIYSLFFPHLCGTRLNEQGQQYKSVFISVSSLCHQEFWVHHTVELLPSELATGQRTPTQTHIKERVRERKNQIVKHSGSCFCFII